jgi:hypothetical protein
MKTPKLVCLALALGLIVPTSAIARSALLPKETVEDGLHVFIHEDGLATIARDPAILADRWLVDCRVDAMTDGRPCYFHNGPGGILVFYELSDAPVGVCIVDHDHPARTGQIRVDKHEAFEMNSRGCIAASRILEQLKTGNAVLTRRYEWPKDKAIDMYNSLVGFNKALEIVDRIRSQ